MNNFWYNDVSMSTLVANAIWKSKSSLSLEKWPDWYVYYSTNKYQLKPTSYL